MPTYLFVKRDDQEEENVWEENMTIAQMETYLKENPDVRQVFGAPKVGDSYRMTAGMHKPDQGFRDLLREMKAKNRRSTINTFD